ncbi:hypothetical protein ACQP26_19170 [Micromonospora sp. CA-248089]|uniref:hypothetical protein n=1 Tax=unclassified Micromonospora TaxID=2617518 RepID=UPI00248C668C|nr:hypothetical protein [Micromonospora sp. WMMA1947]WBC07566.1 hypothetical protein O7604_20375 [Micromonospora sp. WMMA1947]
MSILIGSTTSGISEIALRGHRFNQEECTVEQLSAFRWFDVEPRGNDVYFGVAILWPRRVEVRNNAN